MDPTIADGERSVILEQVAYGVAVPMAILCVLGGGRAAQEEAAHDVLASSRPSGRGRQVTHSTRMREVVPVRSSAR